MRQDQLQNLGAQVLSVFESHNFRESVQLLNDLTLKTTAQILDFCYLSDGNCVGVILASPGVIKAPAKIDFYQTEHVTSKVIESLFHLHKIPSAAEAFAVIDTQSVVKLVRFLDNVLNDSSVQVVELKTPRAYNRMLSTCVVAIPVAHENKILSAAKDAGLHIKIVKNLSDSIKQFYLHQ